MMKRGTGGVVFQARRVRWRGCGVLVILLLGVGAAHAQSVDYGGLEQIFGEPITTSATGKPQRASDVPADMTIITQDDIRRSGADNIPDILQFVAGIDMRRYSFDDAEIAIRGYDVPLNPRMLVLVDGRQVYSDDFGYVPWSAIPVQLSEIRQIEIVRGPNTALFGFNAASGVINIITFDPTRDTKNSVTFRGGTQGYGGGEGVATQQIGAHAGVRVSVGGWTSTGYAQPNSTSTPVSHAGSINVDGRWQVSSALTLNASGGATDTDGIHNIGIPNELLNRIDYERIGATAQAEIGSIDADIYHNRNTSDYISLGSYQNDVYVARVSDLLKLDASNTVRVGLEFRTNGIRGPGVGGSISYNVVAANAMWDWQIARALEWTNAVRIDYLVLDYDGILAPSNAQSHDDYMTTLSALSFNSGLVIHVTDQDTVRLTASRGLQLPSLIDFGAQTNFLGLVLLGSPHLQPEAVWDTELAYDRGLPWLGATLHGAVFFQRNTDLVVGPGSTTIEVVNGHLTSIAGNIGWSNEIGTEIGLRGEAKGGFRWDASYRYTTITDGVKSDLVDNPSTAYDVGTPHHVVTLGFGYTIGRWEMDLRARGQTSFSDYQDLFVRKTIPDYVSFNASVGFRPTSHLFLQGTAEQFNVTRILEAAGSYVDRRLIVMARLDW
jgi:outer membrane receptor for ferrienterochelin and colicins